MTAPTAADIAATTLASTAAPTADDTFDALTQLADAAGHVSTVLFNYRRDNPDAADVAQALNLELALDKRAIELRTQAVTLLGSQAADAVAQLKQAAGKINGFLADVKKIEGQLTVASAVIGLAAAALVGDTGGIFTAIGGVYTALQSAKS
ncbi:hypothetical protein [Scleromatobacter humisilvae]|uniref:Uncharacterized protein n=1 Tax=Scleromatobacter humisilvae TaxID=2897159 RepID=A0A9X2C108_9BURK|nr:hypothetical protein [Scleromatobacter humisilvae]MCK9685264.1 hypothetical protein [Scleromatobacter humisilvae]